jgi:DNA primase
MRMHSSQKLKAHYKIGDQLQVKVIERVDNTAWIVSLQGVLIQVRNSTAQPLKEGDVILMRLVSLDPPKMSWIEK